MLAGRPRAQTAAADPVLTAAYCRWDGLPEAARAVPGGFPVLFHGVEGEDEREGNSPSWFNIAEAQVRAPLGPRWHRWD